MRHRSLLVLLGAAACAPDAQSLGGFSLAWEGGTLTIDEGGRRRLDIVGLSAGTGSAEITHQVGSYLFEDEVLSLTRATAAERQSGRKAPVLALRLQDDRGEDLLLLQAAPVVGQPGLLRIDLAALSPEANRIQARFACAGGGRDSFFGGGGHAFDVDHAGEAFPLWVSEPGITKRDTDGPSDSWFIEGARHAASYPVPFFVHAPAAAGVSALTWSRVEADLCATDPESWSMTGWDGRLTLLVTAADSPLGVVERHTLAPGPLAMPPDWAFYPWNDAVRGEARVREVARTLREAGAPSSVIWSEDWKGAEETPLGYKLSDEWFVDTGLYPDAPGLDRDLEALGFKWLGYFAPFLTEGSVSAAEAADFTIQHPDGGTYWMTGSDFHSVTSLDPTNPAGVDWALEQMEAKVALGFDGWMVDFAEWLPPDARLAGMHALDEHNAFPNTWHTLNAMAVDGRDAVLFTRSGWWGTGSVSPVTWLGDQQTDFSIDDGLPTILPMAMGTSISGSPFLGFDIAGYSTVGTSNSTKELWFRWCSLGAFSPIMRTHHGREDTENWQFDRDEETLAHFTRYAREHAALFPYLRGLAAVAARKGTPIVLPPALVYRDDDPARVDAYLLGAGVLVAPVVAAGASSRAVTLPPGPRWFDYWTGAEAQSGSVAAPVTEIPVFVAEGTILPLFADPPDTLAPATDPSVRTAADADGARRVRVFGAGGAFTEADGTRYRLRGTPTEAAVVTRAVRSGEIEVGGATLVIEGPVERSYTVEVVP